MELRQLHTPFAVCKIPGVQSADLSREFVFLAKTDDEISLVCESGCAPTDATDLEDGWRALKIEGVLDFGMVGVVAELSALLAKEQISIFVISTYNTDYLLLKGDMYTRAVARLREAGHVVR